MDIDCENIELFMPGDIITEEPGLMRYFILVDIVVRTLTKKLELSDLV
jgi:hypothetical protein